MEDRTIQLPTHAVPLRVYRPAGAGPDLPVVLWFHGGGFVFADLDTADGICRALALGTGACVVSVAYRLAPEHTLAEALDDCVTAGQWVADNASALDVDPRRIAVGGDSAGGAWASLVAHSWSGPHPLVCQLLVYPATDLSGSFAAQADLELGLSLDSDSIEWLQREIGRGSSMSDPQFSPLHQVDRQEAPPTVLLTTGFDALRDEGLEYASRLLERGVPVLLLHYPGQVHGFLSFDRVLSGAVDALGRLADAYLAALDHGLTTQGWDITPPYATARDRWRWATPRQRVRELGVAVAVLRESRSTRRARPAGPRTRR